jgi:hypothetical protein
VDTTNDPILNDPVELVRRLDVATLRRRIEDLGREQEALRVLLRTALRAQRDDPVEGQGGTS